jgi:hypothetical protein
MLSNVYHEVGHCLYFEHAPGGGAGGVRADRHDTSDVCVLSYADCVGDYCGHCLGALMGFDETSADFKPGPPPPPSPPAPSPGGSPGGPSRPGLAGRGRSAPAPGPGIESVVDAPEPKVTE